MERLKALLSKLVAARGNAPGAAMRYIHWYAAFVAVSVTLYIVMLCADWYASGRPDLAATREFLTFLLSGSAVAAVAFVARWLVDKDGDGVPDVVQGVQGLQDVQDCKKEDEHGGEAK